MNLLQRISQHLGTSATPGAEGPVKAVWNGAIVAESDETIVVEGNHYFPPESLRREYFVPSDRETTCPWKGRASYLTVEVDGERNTAAAWTYPSPKPGAEHIRGRVAFWHGVKVVPAE